MVILDQVVLLEQIRLLDWGERDGVLDKEVDVRPGGDVKPGSSVRSVWVGH